MENKKLKKIMTDLVKGKISKLEAESLMEEEKMHPEALKQEFEGNYKGHARKRSNKVREVKQ